MTELTLLNTLEVHPDWLFEIQGIVKMNYPSVSQFATDNNIDYLDAFWFFKGNPVYQDAFRAICEALDFDCGAIQVSKAILPPNEWVVSEPFIQTSPSEHLLLGSEHLELISEHLELISEHLELISDESATLSEPPGLSSHETSNLSKDWTERWIGELCSKDFDQPGNLTGRQL